MNNKVYLLALNRITNVGPRAVMKFLERWPELKTMFSLSKEQLETAGLTVKMAAAISNFDFKAVEMDLAWEQKNGNHLISLEDEHYPALLKEIYDPPTVLYARGNIHCLQTATVAIVGTRKPSFSGGETAQRFARELSCHNLTIVSGLAEGIDTYAHQGCLDANGKTIAVMGTGINRIYPYKSQHLAEKITENGLLVTEFALNCPPRPGHFPRRNRIISGFSLGTLVVEAAIKSGSLITARLAMEQNREVFAIPGSIHNAQARGCHHLLQQGAKLATCIKDITDELGMNVVPARVETKQPALAILNTNLVKCVGFDATTMDEIMKRSGLSFEKVASALVDLELNGVIKTVPGGYARCLSDVEVI